MGEIADALKRAKTRLIKPHGDDTRDQTPRATDGIARLLRDSSEPQHASPTEPQPQPEPTTSEPIAAPDQRVFSISDKRTRDWASRVVAVAPESQFAVRFRHLAIRVRSDLAKRRRSSLLVTSATSGDGKTTVSINLALALSSIAPESSVALVDLDLRRARVAAALECPVEIGFEDVLAGRAQLADSCIKTNLENLDLFLVGRPDRAPHETLGAASATAAFEDLHSRYDYLICDGPPVLPVPDVPLIESKFGGCLLVVRSRRTRHAALADMMELLPRKSIIGVFLNDAMARRDRSAYGYYYDGSSTNDD